MLGEVKREWNDVDQGDIKENNKNMASTTSQKEYGDASMELIAKVNKKLSTKSSDDDSGEKKDVEPTNNAVEETVKAAEEVVEKAQEKADKVIEKVAEKKEAAPNGMIDIFARVLGDNAKV